MLKIDGLEAGLKELLEYKGEITHDIIELDLKVGQLIDAIEIELQTIRNRMHRFIRPEEYEN